MASGFFFDMPQPSIERRRSPRYLCSQIVELRLDDAVPAVLEDISLEGAGLAAEAPVPRGADLELVTPGLRARAQVRYCLKRETDFRLGVEFLDDARWRPDHWQPEHLFLPPPNT